MISNYDLSEVEMTLLMTFVKHTKAKNISGLPESQLYQHFLNGKEFPKALQNAHFSRFLQTVAILYRKNVLVKVSDFANETGELQIHPDFFDEAIPLYEVENADNSVPASDRFVSISDNQSEVSLAKDALDELSTAIRKSNDALTANPEDRLQLSKEIDAIKELISQPRIHVAALYDTLNANSTLRWLMEQTISGIVRDIAVKAFEHLDKLFSLLK